MSCVYHYHKKKKKKLYGISCQIFGLIFSFLSHRRLQVPRDVNFSQAYTINADVPQGFILGLLLSLLYINDLPDDFTYKIVTLVWSAIWFVATTRVDLWIWIWSTRHCGLGQEVACWFHCWKTYLVSFYLSNNSGTIDMKMYGFVLEEKLSWRWGYLFFFFLSGLGL